VLAALVACAPSPVSGARRLVVVAVDALDPELIERLIGERRLPNLAALATASGVVRVTPTPGAESTSAWASLATGVNPGAHGLFDLVAPDAANGRPTAAPLVSRPSARFLNRWFVEGPAYAVVRGGEPVWSRLGRAGIATAAFFVPGTFPPEPIDGGALVSGWPLPDLAGRLGGYSWLATDVDESRTGDTRFGGRVQRLSFARNVARVTIPGITSPVPIDLPVTITRNPEARSANVDIGGRTVYLAEGQQSRWVEVTISLNLLTRITGLAQLHLVKAGNDLQLFISSIQWHPHRPPSPISAPRDAAEILYERLGPYRTLGWSDLAWAVADGFASEAWLIETLQETFDDRAESLLNRVESRDWSVIVCGIETMAPLQQTLWRLIDLGHPMYDAALAGRYGRAIDEGYDRLDRLVGDLRARLTPEDDLIVVSPFGLSTTRHVVDLNRWLTEEGLLVWRERARPVSLARLSRPDPSPDPVDWTKTAAHAMGFGQIFLNVAGRPQGGIVQPGAEQDALVDRLKVGLERLTDPLSGRRVVSRVRTAHEAYRGAYVPRAPDLVVSLSPGYRASWDSVLGGAAASVIAPNLEAWSADHASMDERAVPGVWLSSFPLDADAMSVLDVAPTLLGYFGQPAPSELDGTSRIPSASDQRPRP
jgi:predicted AlkP superfamily phosphohydrolase/phosphomutase